MWIFCKPIYQEAHIPTALGTFNEDKFMHRGDAFIYLHMQLPVRGDVLHVIQGFEGNIVMRPSVA